MGSDKNKISLPRALGELREVFQAVFYDELF
jgi:hypothetical protein